MKPWVTVVLLFLLPASGTLSADTTENRQSSAVSPQQLFIQTIIVEGSTVFTEQELHVVTAPYSNRKLTFAQLEQLRNEISELYLERGYINSGVIIPDQQIHAGIVKFQAVEGQLNQVHISGNDTLKPEYIESRVLNDITLPLNVNSLQQNLELLREDRMIKALNTRLVPGDSLGESELLVAIQENEPITYSVGINNHRAPSIGAERGYFRFQHQNLTGRADNLMLMLGLTQGVEDISAGYQLPIGSKGHQLTFLYQESDSKVIEEPFDNIDVESNSTTYGVGFDYSFYRSTTESLIGIFMLEKKRSATTVLGFPFSFSASDDEGVSKVSVAQMGFEWTKRSRESVFVLRSLYRQGLDLWDATIHDNIADGEFSSWINQIVYARKLPWRDSQLSLRFNTQLTDEPLLSIEKYPVGGVNSVRGYRENQFVRDNAAVLNLELRIPVGSTESGSANQWYLVPFLDMGQTWDENEA